MISPACLSLNKQVNKISKLTSQQVKVISQPSACAKRQQSHLPCSEVRNVNEVPFLPARPVRLKNKINSI